MDLKNADGYSLENLASGAAASDSRGFSVRGKQLGSDFFQCCRLSSQY